ncbi:FAD-binding Berberine family protein [Forsythia ovata]|uniref:FAD-binding Berberine family protein n=1 Tax=Forsythia ovata TaxID=205694 RepID=A0ABD1S222_9LAMI
MTALQVSHIQAAIVCSKIHGLQMKICSGGHDYEGISYVSDVPFFILDMFNFQSINVSIENEIAWVQVRAILGEFTTELQRKVMFMASPLEFVRQSALAAIFSGGGYGNVM